MKMRIRARVCITCGKPVPAKAGLKYKCNGCRELIALIDAILRPPRPAGCEAEEIEERERRWRGRTAKLFIVDF